MIIVGLALAIAFVWVVFTTFWIWRNQEHVVFQPPLFQPSELVDSARVEFSSADGQPLFGYLIRPVAAASTVVIAFHGNADIAAWCRMRGQEYVGEGTAEDGTPTYSVRRTT